MRPADRRRQRAAERANVADLTQRGLITVELFDDPVEQLMYEVRHLYLHKVPPADRERYRLREYRLSGDFVCDLMEASQQLSRGTLVAAIMDVVCGLAWDSNSRSVREMRTDAKPSAPQMSRGDGAYAWRANVQHGVPAARRIMWWTLPDNTLELARLATHDDVRIPA